MHAVAPLHPERARFEGGPVEVAPGVHPRDLVTAFFRMAQLARDLA